MCLVKSRLGIYSCKFSRRGEGGGEGGGEGRTCFDEKKCQKRGFLLILNCDISIASVNVIDCHFDHDRHLISSELQNHLIMASCRRRA